MAAFEAAKTFETKITIKIINNQNTKKKTRTICFQNDKVLCGEHNKYNVEMFV